MRSKVDLELLVQSRARRLMELSSRINALIVEEPKKSFQLNTQPCNPLFWDMNKIREIFSTIRCVNTI